MTYGSFVDMYQNEIRLYSSSNVEGGFWMKVKQLRSGDEELREVHAHLSVNDAKVLIALLVKAIAHQEGAR